MKKKLLFGITLILFIVFNLFFVSTKHENSKFSLNSLLKTTFAEAENNCVPYCIQEPGNTYSYNTAVECGDCGCNRPITRYVQDCVNRFYDPCTGAELYSVYVSECRVVHEQMNGPCPYCECD